MLFKDNEIRELYSIFEEYFSTAQTDREIGKASRELIPLLKRVERRMYRRARKRINGRRSRAYHD